ncbi:MAG: hypothetical protein KY476_00585 [Planctomycetes bacterium]|nr:hypothetical protein [Planctomycetota bacterium]
MDKYLLRKRIIRRLQTMRRDLRDTIAMKESWNDNRPDEMPFDVGWEKTVLRYVEKSLEAWAIDDIAAVNHWMGKMNEATR